MGGCPAGRAPRRHDRDRKRQDARVQPPCAGRDRPRPEDAHAVPLPDEGARAGPGARALCNRCPRRPSGDLRRGHADRAAKPDPRVGERDPHEPGHAPHRPPATPRPLGRCAREPRLRRRRRGARLPRRVRLARRKRPAPSAAACPRLRRGSAVPARLGDDRQPVGASTGADRPRDNGRRRRRSATGGAHGALVEPAAARHRAEPARERAGRSGAHRRHPRRARAADALLREEPQGGGADPPLHARPPGPGVRGPALPLSRRLHA